MKRNVGYFIGGILIGMVAGVLLVLVATNSFNDIQGPGNLKVKPVMFEKPGALISTNNFRVFQGLSKGYALAVELEKGTYSNMESASGVTVLLMEEDRQFEDQEVIKMPKGKCARQVGTYKYSMTNGSKKTVPVVKFMDIEK